MNLPLDATSGPFITRSVDPVQHDFFKILLNQLDFWLEEKSTNPLPLAEIVQAFHLKGKHFVEPVLLQRLSEVRKRISAASHSESSWVSTLLATLLDKHDDKYDYRSYLALEVLNWDEDATGSEMQLDWRLTLLTFDILRFELAALNGSEDWLPRLPTDESLASMRGRRLVRAMQAPLRRQQLVLQPDAESILADISQLWTQIEARMNEADRRCLYYSMLPVDKVHDEYLFLRILQSFETVFSWLASKLKRIIELGTYDIQQSCALMTRCHHRLCEASQLFPLLSSLRAEAFRDFRTHTEGASAIQSRSYKTVESLCRQPDSERLNSIAYASVPEVQNYVLQQPATIDSIYREMHCATSVSASALTDFSLTMNKFEAELKKWRQSHYGIAVKMLGMASGTGYTEGTPYLNDVRHIAVFDANKNQEVP